MKSHSSQSMHKVVGATDTSEHPLSGSGKRQRRCLGYLSSRRSTKPERKTADFSSPKAVSCFLDLVCSLFVVEGHRVEFFVGDFPVPTFRAFKREWKVGVPAAAVFVCRAVEFRVRLDTLPFGRVMGLRAFRMRVNSCFSRRSALKSRAPQFRSGGFLLPGRLLCPDSVCVGEQARLPKSLDAGYYPRAWGKAPETATKPDILRRDRKSVV